MTYSLNWKKASFYSEKFISFYCPEVPLGFFNKLISLGFCFYNQWSFGPKGVKEIVSNQLGSCGLGMRSVHRLRKMPFFLKKIQNFRSFMSYIP